MGIAIDSRDVKTATKDLDAFGKEAKEVTKEIDKLGDELQDTGKRIDTVSTKTGKGTRRQGKYTKSLKETNKTLKQTSGSSNALARATTALMAAFSINRVFGYADAWTGAQNSLRQVTKTSEELADVTQRLRDVAKGSRTSYAVTTDLYAKMARASDELGLSQSGLIAITETINKSFASNSASIIESSNAIRQLSQGFASGVLRGDEFNSVAEQAPGLMRAIAKSVGMTKGELREFAATGGITAKIMVKAFQDQASAIDEDFGKSMALFSQKTTIADDNLTEFLGTSMSVKAVVKSAGDSLVFLSENLAKIGGAAAGVAAATAAIYLMNNAIKAATASMALFNAVSNLNPLVLLGKAVLVTTAAIAAYVLVSSEATAANREQAFSVEQLSEQMVNIGRVYAANGQIVGQLTETNRAARITELKANIESQKSVMKLSELKRASMGEETSAIYVKIQALLDMNLLEAAADPLQTKKLKNLRAQIKEREALSDFQSLEWKMANASIESHLKEIETLEKATVGVKKRSKAQIVLKKEVKETVFEYERMGIEAVKSLDMIEEATKSLTSNMTDSFMTAFEAGKFGFSDMIQSMMMDMLKLQVQQNISGPISGLLSGLIGGLFGGGGATDTVSSAGQTFIPHAKGGVPGLSSFSSSVVSSPTKFAAGGMFGEMGEKGTEGILPLKTMPNGNLGVESSGGGGKTVVVNNVSIINNAGAEVRETKRTENSSGGMDIELTIIQAVNSGMEAGAFDNVMATRYNNNPKGI